MYIESQKVRVKTTNKVGIMITGLTPEELICVKTELH